jgi:hypothetical protein
VVAAFAVAVNVGHHIGVISEPLGDSSFGGLRRRDRLGWL